MPNKQSNKNKPTGKARAKTPAKAEKSKLPILGIVLGVVAVALIVAVMFAGDDNLGGSEFGEPEITGSPLPATLDSNPADASVDPAFGVGIPEVSGQDFDGNTVEINNDGQPKAILFVSHSCPHCRDEIPEVQGWLDATGGVAGVDLITVSTSANSAAGNWPPSEWLEDAGWEAPVIADDSDSSTFFAYGGSAIPYWVFVDADGRVTRRNVGRMPIAGVEAAMMETLR